MLSRRFSHQVFTRTAAILRSSNATTVIGSTTVDARRFIMSEAELAPMDQLSDSRQKLRQALDSYRQNNFGQTLFSRFVKEMILATDVNHDGKISKLEMRNMLKKIGVDQVVADEDVDAVFAEVGHEENGEHLIYVDEIEAILTQPSAST